MSTRTPKRLGMVAACMALACLALAAPAQQKVLRLAQPSAESSFDPHYEFDEPSGTCFHWIFESLLTYDYLARPPVLKPLTVEAMPEISADGLTYTFRIRKGIYFTDDPAFNGQKRELSAADFVYSLKRLLDPQVRARAVFLLEGKLVGMDAVVEAARKTGKFDYDAPVEGIRALDRYTLQLKLTSPDYNLLYALTMPQTSAVAREVVDRYGADFGAHPVGTGPYKLKDWRRASRVVLERNPAFREETWQSEVCKDARASDEERAVCKRLQGKRIPLIDRIEISTIEEEQPRWLAFLNGDHDFVRPVPRDFAGFAIPGGTLSPKLAAQGIRMTPDEVAWVTYTTFNMRDPIVGGYTAEKTALRRAISLAYRVQDEVKLLRNGHALVANSPLHPAVQGYSPAPAPSLEYNPAKARALLDLYGYKDRDGDGYREMPDGSPLTIDQASIPTLFYRQVNQLWKSSMDAIGIRMTFIRTAPLQELRKAATNGQIQSFSYGWIADYPDAENIFQLFWKGSIGGANYTLFDLPEFNEMYEKVKRLPQGPERMALYDRMNKTILAYAPWRPTTYVQDKILVRPWLIGYRKHPFMHEGFPYMDIDLDELKKHRDTH